VRSAFRLTRQAADARDELRAIVALGFATKKIASKQEIPDMSYRAQYLGDGNYPSKTADCEPLHVTPVPAPSIAIVKNPKSQTVPFGERRGSASRSRTPATRC
jgi:hypothetical protein